MYIPPYFNVFLLILAIWTIVWKVYAVWFAAKHNQKKWFLAMIILNTIGILEIFYVFKILKKSLAEVKMDFQGAWKSFK